MDCEKFAKVMEEAKQTCARALRYVENGDAKNASYHLDRLEEILEQAREELGDVGGLPEPSSRQ